MRFAASQLRTLVLILSFVVGPLVCMCAHAMAAAAPTNVHANVRPCCVEVDQKTAAEKSDATHHEDCPHCAQAKRSILAAEAAAAPDLTTLQLAAFDVSLFTADASLADAATLALPLACARKIPPPPDLLRVKCSLQI